jgi:MFS family permease
MATDSIQRKFGPVRLVQGVTFTNMLTYYMATVLSLFLMTFMPQFQPFLLTDFLKIPESQQGVLSGNLAFVSELVILLSIGAWGTVSDKTGRKFVFSAGFLIMSVGLYLYPTVNSITVLYLLRGLFALGAAAVTTMVATVIADYAINEDRGKASGLQGIGNGLGAMLTVFLVLQLPKIFMGGGSTATSAGQLTYWIMAGTGILAAIILGLGLQNRTQVQKEQKKSILKIAQEGIVAAKDPGIALVFHSRIDFTCRNDHRHRSNSRLDYSPNFWVLSGSYEKSKRHHPRCYARIDWLWSHPTC